VKLLDIELTRRLGSKVDTRVAVENAKAVLRDNPDNLIAHMLLADAYMYDGQAEQALAAFERVIVLHPKHPGALFGMGQLYWAENKVEEARAIWEKLLEVDKESVKALQLIMNSYMAAGEPAEALKRCDAQIQRSRQNPAFRELRAILLIQTGEYEAALAALQKALALDAQRAQPYFLLGTLHEAQQQMGKAKERYEKALELNQHHALAANNLAWIYLEVAGDVDRAWSLASRAYELAPQDPNVMDTLGWIYFKNSSYDL
jgi:tetratricopeptide (TPR) repeat protein